MAKRQAAQSSNCTNCADVFMYGHILEVRTNSCGRLPFRKRWKGERKSEKEKRRSEKTAWKKWKDGEWWQVFPSKRQRTREGDSRRQGNWQKGQSQIWISQYCRRVCQLSSKGHNTLKCIAAVSGMNSGWLVHFFICLPGIVLRKVPKDSQEWLEPFQSAEMHVKASKTVIGFHLRNSMPRLVSPAVKGSVGVAWLCLAWLRNTRRRCRTEQRNRPTEPRYGPVAMSGRSCLTWHLLLLIASLLLLVRHLLLLAWHLFLVAV